MVQKLVQKSDLNTSTFKNVGVRYIYQFRGTYYFRYVVPKAHRNLILGAPKQFKLSLHTSSYTLAIERVAPLWRCVEAVKSSLAPDQVTVHYKKLVSELERLRYSARTSPDSSYPLLKDSWYSLLKSKNWKEKRLSTANQMFRNIEFYLGNKPVNQYSVRDLQDCLKRIATLPVRNKFPYRSMQLEEVLHLKNVPVEDYVSDKTVKEHLKLLVMLFTSYLCEEMKVLVESPAQGLKVTVKESRFGAFTDKQIKSILVTM
ncbi:DUF6538 domain-containing protein [Marinobacterium sp. xm-d-564]|uniref:DUF6538 domain-containing protein n=1 Tax=Marinobacterium sp. xm-d-564 TaxID=2497742 RepID=UPI00156A0A79|nr:DUF6538 domain-containing protein [Marinobacterium sp. xm-d-564]NRP59735.1 hypothetical protein [Marinobacterium sp. xm-d-564]